MVDAITDIHIKATWRTKQGFVLGRPAPVTMAGGFILGIRLCFHNHAPKQAAVLLAFHQPATDQLRTHDLSGARKERERQVLQFLDDGLAVYRVNQCWQPGESK